MAKKKSGKKALIKKPISKADKSRNIFSRVSSLKKLNPDSTLELIRFDLRTHLFIVACLIAFLICILLKWNYSSIARWNEVVNDGGDIKRGLVFGTQKKIRSDEWLVSTSFMLSQHAEGYPVVNESLGAGKIPLLMGLPTTKFISKIKPSMWGFYFLDIERAYSWYWNFKIFPFLIASYLLLMLFTKNNFIISVFGSFWLLMSSAVLWWSIATEPFTFGFAAIITFIYLIYSKKIPYIILNGVLFIVASFSFVMILYPAWQVPLAYLLLALLVGYLFMDKTRLIVVMNDKRIVKSLVLLLSLGILSGLLALFILEIKESYEIVSNTVYPGKRFVTGGDFRLIKLFNENYSLFTDMVNFPTSWINICELSSFLMLFPFAFVIIILDYIRSRQINILLFVLMVFQILMLVWMIIGFPLFISKWTLLSMSPPYRTIFIFGFGNVLFTLLFLAHHKHFVIKNKTSHKLITFVVLFILSFVINYLLNKDSNIYFSTYQFWLSTIIYSLLSYFSILYFMHAIYQVGFYIVCLIYLIPNFKILPVNDGLAAYYDNEIFKVVSEIEDFDPNKGWIVFGQGQWGNYLKAAGINCFNGVKFAPHLDKMHVLDPYETRDSIYNRYAHILYTSYIYRDSVHFMVHGPDVYSVQMDPCSPRFHELGIKYFLFTYGPPPEQVRCMTLMMEDNLKRSVYKRNDL